MKVKAPKSIPLILLGAVTGLVLLAHALGRWVDGFDAFQRLEWMTFDWRVRHATNTPAQNASNLGFVFISNDSIEEVASGSLGYSAGLYWPRFVHGFVVEELRAQDAEAVAFDVLFTELRRDQTNMPAGASGTPDEYFAGTLRAAGNVILGAEAEAIPHALFRTNAWAMGNIAAIRDADGILRRSRAFEDYVIWHPMILEAARKFDGFTYDTNRLVFTSPDRTQTVIPIEVSGSFDAGKLLALGSGLALPPGPRRVARAFTRERVWDLGLALAARSLHLDLDHALIEPGRIVLRGPGVERTIPIDSRRRFYIDWSFPLKSAQLTSEAFHSLLRDHADRARGETVPLRARWKGKLAIVGSIASGNDLRDFGATPLEKETFLTSRTGNVANSLLTGRFVHQSSLAVELLLILALGVLAGVIAGWTRAIVAALLTFLVAALHVFIATELYAHSRLWVPVVMPCAALLLTHFALITHRAVAEQTERRRIKGVFDKIVSPNVVNELLKAEKLSLGGARRPVSVFFADVRGFTEMTDESHARAAAQVTAQQLDPSAAEDCLDRHASELLRTINLYLGAIADVVKKHDGTLDKYIGDCVMAFWGAPTPNTSHALSAVRAAIDSQRAIHMLNQQRAAENKRIEEDNTRRATVGQSPLPLQKLLAVGIGLNTGIVTVGLMGSEQHTFNYTILGRDVNLAQRLESHSGRARIFIGESTYQELLRDDSTLAAICQPVAPAQFKGFREAVKLYEVPWKPSATDGFLP